jgi:hypothetical protein
MKNLLNYLQRLSKEVRLKQEEKSQARDTLMSYMREYPVRNEEVVRHQYQRVNIMQIFANPAFRPAFVAFSLVVVIGGFVAISERGGGVEPIPGKEIEISAPEVSARAVAEAEMSIAREKIEYARQKMEMRVESMSPQPLWFEAEIQRQKQLEMAEIVFEQGRAALNDSPEEALELFQKAQQTLEEVQ